MAKFAKILHIMDMKRLGLFILFSLIFFNLNASAESCLDDERILRTEHMFCEDGALSDEVIITNLRNIICKGNIFKVAFECKFWSECAKAGDRVNFSVPESIYTQEGTLLIPSGSRVVATVLKIEKQRIPNKNARVFLKFECLILPDGSAVVMSGIPGGGLIGEMLIVSLYGFPLEAFPIIATIGWLIDPPATCLNVVGDVSSSMLVTRLVEGKDWIKEK